jgi:hypothetical protein
MTPHLMFFDSERSMRAEVALLRMRMSRSGFPDCEPTQPLPTPALLTSLPEPARSQLHR